MCIHEVKQVNFRIQKDLYEWLRRQADKERRSVTAQINLMLEKIRSDEDATT